MEFKEDPRVRASRKSFFLSWLFFSLFVLFVMGLSYLLGVKPHIWGLPRWITIGNILVPAFFVILLIFVVERFIPNIPLTDKKNEREEKK